MPLRCAIEAIGRAEMAGVARFAARIYAMHAEGMSARSDQGRARLTATVFQAAEPHAGKYRRNLMGMSPQQVLTKFGPSRDQVPHVSRGSPR